MGFTVTEEGDLMNPETNETIEHGIMNPDLFKSLKFKGVNLADNYRNWSDKSEMLQKLSIVMGLKCPDDPDTSYVLTVDNIVKIVAIQMRFR